MHSGVADGCSGGCCGCSGGGGGGGGAISVSGGLCASSLDYLRIMKTVPNYNCCCCIRLPIFYSLASLFPTMYVRAVLTRKQKQYTKHLLNSSVREQQ